MRFKRVLIVGGGGREHALAWKIAQSPKVEKVFVAPGNAGTAREKKCENVAIDAEDIPALFAFAREYDIGLTVVGPENPLAAGISDTFQKGGLKIFGPTKAAARLEESKSFAKEFLKRHNIPTAAYETFTDITEAENYIRAQGAPIVIKADGLAAGKGVLVAENIEEAIAFARDCLSGKKFGEAGGSIVVEEFMEGEEASFICIVDGAYALPLANSQDHKRVFDGDNGPNTGGMGAYSPAPIVAPDVEAKIIKEIMEPTVRGMAEEGASFVGFLYAGLMIKDGQPRVVEFNVRFGDPEAEPVLMRLQSDLFELIEAALDGQLSNRITKWDKRAALGVVMSAGGYPEKYEKGHEIIGLENAESETVKVFHAGTAKKEGKLVTNGGRVLCVTALGDTIANAQKSAYEAVKKIHWKDVHYRTDIGWRALPRAPLPY
jgi:phosphoribosylamine--glycine ligase